MGVSSQIPPVLSKNSGRTLRIGKLKNIAGRSQIMLKSSDVVGKPVLRNEINKQADTVQDIIFDPEAKRILGFVVDEGGLFKEARIMLWEGIERIDEVGVSLVAEKYLIPANYAPPIQEMMEQGNTLYQTKVITTSGEEVGQLADVYFSETTGKVEGFDVVGPETQATDEVIFVPMSIIAEMNRNMIVINGTMADVLDWVKA